MSPDTNSTELPESPEEVHRRTNGIHKQAAVPEEVLNNNGMTLHSLQRIAKTGGTAEDVPNDFVSAKAAVGEQSEEDDKLQEYLQRRDTAVIYPEPVGRAEPGESFCSCWHALFPIRYNAAITQNLRRIECSVQLSSNYSL